MTRLAVTRSSAMRAVRIIEPGRTVLDEVPLPEPSATEVRIRIEGCGLCASNLGPWRGLAGVRYPLEPGGAGHEAWGVVDTVGRAVDGILPGDRVAALTSRSFAEYDVAEGDALVRLPRAMSDTAFPGEPFGCAANIFRRSDICSGQSVAIVGIGFLGAVVTRLAARAGARVVAISRRSFSLELARRMGADECIPLNDHEEVVELVRGLTDGVLCDRVIEATGMQWPLDVAADLARVRGRLVIAGYHQDGPRRVDMQTWNWKGLDVVNAHERHPDDYVRGMREALDAIEQGALDPNELVTHEFPLERLGEALDATAERPDGFVKAVVRP